MPKKNVENQDVDKNVFFEKKTELRTKSGKTRKSSDNLYAIYLKKIDKK